MVSLEALVLVLFSEPLLSPVSIGGFQGHPESPSQPPR